MILQGVKLPIQPLGVGYPNRPKKAQNGGVCGIFPHIRLPHFDLTTSFTATPVFGFTAVHVRVVHPKRGGVKWDLYTTYLCSFSAFTIQKTKFPKLISLML